MIATLLFALAAQAKTLPVSAPIFPPMSSAMFQDTVLEVEKQLQKGEFAAAAKTADLLPKNRIGLSYDEKNLPLQDRPAFRAALAGAIQSWPTVHITTEGKADIKLSFQPTLAADPQTGSPAHVALFFNTESNLPREEAVVGLKRGSPLHPTTPDNFAGDVKFVIGSYIGLAKINIAGRAMNSSDDWMSERAITARDQEVANACLNLSNRLRAAVAAKKIIGVSRPASAFIDPPGFDGDAIQGDQLDLPIQISNRGQGMLAVVAEGDCGCVLGGQLAPVAPGESGLLKARIDTKEITGPVERKVFVYTNDPNLPAKEIPVKLAVSPRYRFFMEGGNARTVEDGGSQFDVFFTYPDGDENKIVVSKTAVVGLEGATATFEPWSGDIGDPALNEPVKTRHGYRAKVSVPGTLPPGRSPITLALFTDVPGFASVYYTINLQKGIVALPEELFLGELAHTMKKSTVLLSRPGKPFVVRSVRSTLRNFSAAVVPSGRPDEVKIEVTYDGKAPAGSIEGAIVVETNDPKQPTVKISVVGSSS